MEVVQTKKQSSQLFSDEEFITFHTLANCFFTDTQTNMILVEGHTRTSCKKIKSPQNVFILMATGILHERIPSKDRSCKVW